MKEIEPGYYMLRAKGLDKQGEMIVAHSYRSYLKDYDDLKKLQKKFLAECRTDYGIVDPILTHTTRDSNQDNWDYLA